MTIEFREGMTLAELTAGIRENNVAKGWRPAEGGPGDNTWGDYVALLHSEVSEMLEAYRDHRLTDATEDIRLCVMSGQHRKHLTQCGLRPEGVGSELADCIIRLLDMADVFELKLFADHEPDIRLGDVLPSLPWMDPTSFGDWIAELHVRTCVMWTGPKHEATYAAESMLGLLVMFADTFELDMDREVVRKMRYNQTRPYQHGGRTMADPK